MLTGAMSPSQGYLTVAGKDIRSDLKAIRQDLGICLQHDCLFPNLTVREHVQFFARLKGVYTKLSRDEAEDQVDQSIRDVALFEKRNTLSKDLSGGMKRKLSVAIAFSGGSSVVILDEPTSGMVSHTWYAKWGSVFTSTHFRLLHFVRIPSRDDLHGTVRLRLYCSFSTHAFAISRTHCSSSQ
jgi:ABC-type lipoprotein export system ATPase subunit